MRPIVWTRRLWVAAAVAGPLGWVSLAAVHAEAPAVETTAEAVVASDDNPFADMAPDIFADAAGSDPFRAAESTSPTATAEAPQPLDLTEAAAAAAGGIAIDGAEDGFAEPSAVQTAGFETTGDDPGVQPVSWWDDAPAASGPTNTPVAPQTPAAVVTPVSAAAPAAASGDVIAAATYEPAQTEQAGTAAVELRWTSLTPVNIGQECRCSLVATNTGGEAASGVTVEAHFPKSIRLTAVTPQPTAVQSFLGWDLGELPAGASRTLEISYVPSVGGAIEPRASVRFTATRNASFEVLRPDLSAELVAGGEVQVGEPAPQTVRLHNPGTGIARNVQVEVSVPSGLSHPAGQRLVTDVGLLHPGETRTIRVALAAISGGTHTVTMKATADGNLLSESVSTVAVVTPKLQATVDGPTLRYLGRTADYDLTVTNDGASADENVRLMHKVPAGYEFVSASRGSRYDAASRIVSWFVGRVEAGESKSVRVTLKASQAGSHTHFVRASGEHGVLSDTTLQTQVEAVSLIGVEVADLEDPVEVGREVGYEIRVSNEGSAAATDVELTCSLPDGARVTRAEGPVGYDATGGAVQFAPLGSLAPGQTRTFRVMLTGTVPGNGYFKASVKTEGAEPITSEELTRFYGER